MSESPHGLGYEDDLAVGWDAGSERGEESLHRTNMDAVRTLKALASLEEGPRDIPDESSVLGHEMHRIEGKLDLVLSLVSNIPMSGTVPPHRRKVIVRADGIEWLEAPDDLKLEEGESGTASIFFYPRLPVPVRLSAVVEKSGQGHVAVRFTRLTTELRNILERHVFRHHRRAIARAREARSDSGQGATKS